MHRRPSQLWPYGFASANLDGGGYFHPAQFLQNVNPHFPPNILYPQHATNFPHDVFQNPGVSLQQNTFIGNAGFPATRPSSVPSVKLETVEREAAKAHHDLVVSGVSVSAWKVFQNALSALKVDSWSSLGFHLQDVPTLQRLLVVEGKVNALIHCFVCARKIISMYELEVALCQHMDVRQFGELGLGPFLRHPLIKHYFSVPSALTDIFKITSEEIIRSLQDFISKSKKVINVEKFVMFLAEQKSVPIKEMLGVRIQDIGFYEYHIREASKAEYTLLREKLNRSRALCGNVEVIGKMHSSKARGITFEKQFLDKRFKYISHRLKTFSSELKDSGNKHIYFVSSDDGDDVCDVEDDREDETDISEHQTISPPKLCGQLLSSCPYPSNSEEMMRLGLEPVESYKPSSAIGRITSKENMKSFKKKRKPENSNNGNSSLKFLKRTEVVDLDTEGQICDHTLSNGDIRKFVATWNVACQKHSLAEVLDMMLSFYVPKRGQKKNFKKLFSSYPAIGCLNVAVMSIKRGMFESIYDTFQALNEKELAVADSVCFGEMIDVRPPVEVSGPTISIDCGFSVTHDDIIKKIANYFENYQMTPKQGGLLPEKKLAAIKKFSDCEMWLMAQFNVQKFCSLGHGNFCDFLEKHIAILPPDAVAFFSNDRFHEFPVEACLNQQQLGVMLSQAEENLIAQVETCNFDTISLLKKQFPTAGFCMIGMDSQKSFGKLINQHKEIGNSSCILFSSCLLGDQWNRNLLCKENSSLYMGGMEHVVAQQHHIRRTSKDAIECLLKAPMLADLLYWSHWDLLHAPSLGPLPEFLLNKINNKNLLCIATVDGKFVRIDHTATVDEFLEAFIQCSSFCIALKFLSLLCLYRGISNAPIALLKCYAQKAVDVIIRNSADSVEVNVNGQKFIPGQIVLNTNSCCNCVPADGNEDYNEGCKRNSSCAGLCRVNSAIATISRTILECLQYLPSEFRSFAAEIFLSGLRPRSKQAPVVILNQCSKTEERIMLHDIGISLGVTEWMTDHLQFYSSIVLDLSVPYKAVEQFSSSFCLAPALDHRNSVQVSVDSSFESQKTSLGKIGDALGLDGNHRLSSGVNCGTSSIFKKHGHIDKSQALCEETAVSIKISEDQGHDATAIVESIRQEEFGLSFNSNKCEDQLLQKQHARLGRALHCLSQELYSHDSHFILELVQNADDNSYPDDVEPKLVFILHEMGIIILNNEIGFFAENIRALCDVGNSTKKGSGGYIGKKGIGFKSVFQVTDAPEIHSNGFHVKFDITEGQIGFVLPTVIPPFDADTFKQYLCGEGYHGNDMAWNTCILLPFRSQSKGGAGVCSIISMFSDLHPSLLLFLHRLRCIMFRNLLDDSFIVMRKNTLHDGIVKVSHGEEFMSWLVASKKLRSSVIRTDVEATEISVAFTLQESENGEYKPILRNQPVFSFLPLRNYGLKFILQGDFVLPSSREEVDGDSAWNQWLLSEFPSLFLSAEQSFCALPCFLENPGKAVTIYMSFVPLVGEVYGFFSQLPQMIFSLLRISNCVLQDSPDLTWVFPCRVLRGWNEQVRLLISDHLLQKYLGLVYLHKDVKLSDTIAMTLGVRDYGPKILVEIMESVCHSQDGLESLGIDWLSAWFATVYSSLTLNLSHQSSLDTELEYNIFNDLQNISLIPLSDGSYGYVADGPIWLPFDILNTGSKGEYHPADFPCLNNKLRIVTSQLFSVATKNVYSMREIRVDNVVQMLLKIGVQQLSAHEVIKSHILAALSKNHASEDKDVMVEYLSFIMLHLQSECVSCHSERLEIMTKLRKMPLLLTNYGFKCPSKEPIHFGIEYVNPVDVAVLFDGVDIKWVEVDASYLKHPSTQSLSSGLMKWRAFFLDLGVTDFVQVTFIDKNVEDFLSEDTMTISSFNSATSYVEDWESPELVNLLTIISSKNLRTKCIYLLDVLDKMWDDGYSVMAKSFIISKTDGAKKPVVSSFMKNIREFAWIAATMDEDLHQPNNVFYDCEQVHSILGTVCPYAVPKINSKLLANDIGFKMEVSIDDAVEILQFWRMTMSPFVASIAQMLKFYALISSALATSSKIIKELISTCFIFVPFMGCCQSSAPASGMFLSPKEVYWQDPTGCVDRMKELILLCPSMNKGNHLLCKSLETVYPTLRGFFVNVCGVPDNPPFSSYFQILQQLSSIALPSQAAHKVFQVMVRWGEGIKSGLVSPDQISELKNNFMKLENAVLPTELDKWVSLHPSFGLVCWADDDVLKKQFRQSDGVHFIKFSKLSEEENAMLSGAVANFFHIIGVPALSEIVSREAIFYGTEENRDKAYLVNCVIRYAQRYIHKLHLETYLKLKQLGFEKLGQLQIVVVKELFYKYTLQGCDCGSKRQFKCNCLLQGNILYTCQTTDAHSIFLELSRYFFNGSSDLHFANFLHMVTTMVQAGSTGEQIDFFVVNSQKIPKLPDDEPLWSISSVCEVDEPEFSQSISKSSHRKPGLSSCWPPTGWKTAPDFKYSRSRNLTWPECSQICFSEVAEDVTQLEAPISAEITGNWTLEEGSIPVSTSGLKDSELLHCQSHFVGHSDSARSLESSASEPTDQFEEQRDINGERSQLINPPDNERINRQTTDDLVRQATGRLGEKLAFEYYTNKHGCTNVNWVNEKAESGLPYDLIVTENETRHYVEVKATRSATKDWFLISTREWMFASEYGDSYSIAHVVISATDRGNVIVLKNPYKLCRERVLGLALMMSKR